jgi:hypothetical protein
MSRPETLKDLKEELASIDGQLAGLRALTVRRTRIAGLIRQWEALYESKKKRKTAKPSLEAVAKRKVLTPTAKTNADYAAQAIQKKGPLKIAQLVEEVRALGWVGSGDDVVDRKRIYVSMYETKGRFSRDNKGNWSIAREQAEAAG